MFMFDSDIHIGITNWAKWVHGAIGAMNGINTAIYPSGGTIHNIRGVIVGGDLTTNGTTARMDSFVVHYGLDGTDGLLNYPCYETAGNHDIETYPNDQLTNMIVARHGSLNCVLSWGLLKVILWSTVPDVTVFQWIETQIDNIPSNYKIVIAQHYVFNDHDNHSWTDWTEAESLAYYHAIAGHSNVLAILHGHTHMSAHYTWNGVDVYSASAEGKLAGTDRFFVVKFTQNELDICEYQWGIDGADSTWDSTGTWVNIYEKNFGEQIPTLQHWGIVLLLLILMGFAVYQIRVKVARVRA